MYVFHLYIFISEFRKIEIVAKIMLRIRCKKIFSGKVMSWVYLKLSLNDWCRVTIYIDETS